MQESTGETEMGNTVHQTEYLHAATFAKVETKLVIHYYYQTFLCVQKYLSVKKQIVP